MSTERPDIQSPAAANPPDSRWQRARRPEQKAERRRAILEATIALLDEVGIEGATLSEIARRSGLSKANCYRYFESREAILLELTLAESSEWMKEIADRLGPLAKSRDLDAVADVFVSSTVARPRLCTLYSAIYSVMERNVSPSGVAEFKREFHAGVFGSSEAITRALPSLTTDDADQFILFMGFFIAGAWPSANPAPGVADALEQAKPAMQPRDFRTTLLAHTRVVLRGLLAERTSS